METHIDSLQIRVLVSRASGEFAARALEMDLLGYGKTVSEAVGELKRAVQAQLTFAHQMGDPGLIGFPAEQEHFDRWDAAQRKAIRSHVVGDRSLKLENQSLVLSFTADELKSLRARRFSKAEPVCA